MKMQKEMGWLLKEKYGGVPTTRFARDVKRLEAGEPADYVIGFTEFLGCRIDLSLRPLIPRPETEYWAAALLAAVKKRKGIVRMLDLFCGSGCVGVAMLAAVPDLLCDFADISPRCLKQAQINAAALGIKGKRYRLIRSNVFSGIAQTYDFIAANPPYIAQARRSKVQPSVLKYEPHRALFAGHDGMRYIEALLRCAKSRLRPRGSIWIEFDPPQKEKIKRLADACGYRHASFFKDQFGKWRWVVVK